MDHLTYTFLRNISRREFLRYAATSLAALFLVPWQEGGFFQSSQPGFDTPPPSQGRVLNNQVTLYEKPDLKSKVIKVYWVDLIVPITAVTIGGPEPAYNRIWYQINHEGYVHSGGVQPVEVQPNAPLAKIPENGFLSEVCVPFTEALWDLRKMSHAYRLYFSTTYWVTNVVQDKTGKLWYIIKDDKYGFNYYVDARHLRPISAHELSPLSPNVPQEEKRIEIRRADQVLVCYENDQTVFMTRTATGARFSDGDYTTREGHYMTNRKRPSRHMAAGDRAAPNSYDLPGVPWVTYLTKNGVSIHGTYWHNDFGKPRSHGCINVSSTAAHWVFRWTLPTVPLNTETWDADIGTSVEVI
jgi:hypothetical protein